MLIACIIMFVTCMVMSSIRQLYTGAIFYRYALVICLQYHNLLVTMHLTKHSRLPRNSFSNVCTLIFI